MEERTRAYLRGRFGDHYRRTEITPPPGASEREWGYIPWTEGPGETMVRHRSLLDLGDLGSFLARERPRHAYFSAGRYDDPGAGTMAAKGWRSSDLIFDLDADHLPSVDPATDSYGEMLAACKDALLRLLDFLETDFAFEDLTVVFSGGRGYHVHVRDEGIQHLEREARREIVDYVRGIGLDDEFLTGRETSGTTTARVLRTRGGWGKRVHDRLLGIADDLEAASRADAIESLTAVEGIGDRRAEQILTALTGEGGGDATGAGAGDAQVEINLDAVREGNLEIGGQGLRALIDDLVTETVAAEMAPIDEPVTTDTNRLIRLPGSIHGGSGLAVQRIPRDGLADFDPLVDPVPETFVGHEISVEVTQDEEVSLRGDSFTLDAGEHILPEYLGVFLMCRGSAEKGPE